MFSGALILAAPLLFACQSLAVVVRQPEASRGLLIPGNKIARRKRGIFDTDNNKLSYKIPIHLIGETVVMEVEIGTTIEFAAVDTVDSTFVVFGPNCTTCPGALTPWEPDDKFSNGTEESVRMFNEGGCKVISGTEEVWNMQGSDADHMQIWVATECQFDIPENKVPYGAIIGVGIPKCDTKGHLKDASKMYRTAEAEEEAESADEAHPPHPRNPAHAEGWQRRVAERKERQRRQQRQREDRARRYEESWHPLGMATDDPRDPPPHPAKPANETEEEWEAHTPSDVIAAPYPNSVLPEKKGGLKDGMPAKAPLRKMASVDAVDAICAESTLIKTWGLHLFSICMHEGHDAWGSLTVNPADPSHNPQVTQHAVPGVNFWSVKVRDLHLRKEGKPFGKTLGFTGSGGVAILDSTSVSLGVPHEIFKQLEEAWNNSALDCNDMTQQLGLGFTIGNSLEDAQSIRLPANAWLRQAYGKTTAEVAGILGTDGKPLPAPAHSYPGPFIGCESMVQDIGEAMTDNGPMFVLGLPFFQSYVTTFHSPPGGNFFLTMQHSGAGCDPAPVPPDQLTEDPYWGSLSAMRKAGAGAGMEPRKRRAAKDLPLPRYVPLDGEILKV